VQHLVSMCHVACSAAVCRCRSFVSSSGCSMLVRAACPARALFSPGTLYARQVHRRSRTAQTAGLDGPVWRCGAASAPHATACPRPRGGRSGGALGGGARTQVILARMRCWYLQSRTPFAGDAGAGAAMRCSRAARGGGVPRALAAGGGRARSRGQPPRCCAGDWCAARARAPAGAPRWLDRVWSMAGPQQRVRLLP
jgi:hypothetical protein